MPAKDFREAINFNFEMLAQRVKGNAGDIEELAEYQIIENQKLQQQIEELENQAKHKQKSILNINTLLQDQAKQIEDLQNEINELKKPWYKKLF
jgi:peptidoglycan hydrolase CwlO-like protein